MKTKELAISIGAGVLSAAVVIASFAALILTVRFVDENAGLLVLLIAVTGAISLSLAALVMPPILVGRKYGTRFGIISVVTALVILATIVWYVLHIPPQCKGAWKCGLF